MHPSLRIAVIGCGKIADGHVEQIRAIGAGEVVAVCDRDPLMASQLAERMQIPGQYTDLARMYAEARPDVVHIATPPDSHVALARQAFEAGCHVFLEKPFAPTAAQTAEILEEAGRRGRKISVNYLYNFESPALELEQLLQRGELGEIVHLDTEYGYNLGGDYGLAVMSNPDHWVHRLPGKLFQNVLDHVLAKIAPFLGDESEMKVITLRRRPSTGSVIVDAMADELRVILRSGGVTAHVMVSAHGRPVAHAMRVIGTRDTVDLDYANRTLVHRARQNQPSAVGRLFPAWTQSGQYLRNGMRNVGRFRRAEFHYFECMRVLLQRFYASIHGTGPDPIAPDQILKVGRLIDQIVANIDADRTEVQA